MGVDWDGLELAQRIYRVDNNGKTTLLRTFNFDEAKEEGKYGTNIVLQYANGKTKTFYSKSIHDNGTPPPHMSFEEKIGGRIGNGFYKMKGNNDMGAWEGEKGLKEKGIPTMLTTAGTILTLGAAAEAGLAGVAAKTTFALSTASNLDDLAGSEMKNGETPISKLTGYSPKVVNGAKMILSGASMIQGVGTLVENGAKGVATGALNTASPIGDAVNATTQAKTAADLSQEKK